jgi:choline dehydrogenase-like flavoprotein
VVLAAGTVENTRLALDYLTEGTSAVAVPGLTDHLLQGVLVKRRRGAAAWPAGYTVRRGDADDRSNYFVDVDDADPDAVVFDAFAIGEQEAGEGSLLRLAPGGDGVLETAIEPRLSNRDETTLELQRQRLTAIVAAAHDPSPEVVFPDFAGATVRLGDALRALRARPETTIAYTVPLGGVDHESGTLPLGGEHVDEDGFLRADPRIAILGPALLPRAGAANPALTALALAERAAAAAWDRVGQ